MPKRHSSKSDTGRSYIKRQRAAQEAATRQRIVEAAVHLHESRGGGATLSEVARRAGVARVTLYRHFPDELALLSACTSHYLARHQPPSLERWIAVVDPIERLELGLRETYAYHRETEAMMTAAEHEVAVNPVLAKLLEPMVAYWAAARQALLRGWRLGAKQRLLIDGAIGVALALPTWRLLTRQHNLSDEQCVAMFVEMLQARFAVPRRR
ncbi:MAG: TetR/AcrR family transcriptional regulator [Gemmatimonadales bacterium]